MVRRAALLCLLAAACGSGENLGFPRQFLWGTAVAGFQVDMGCPTMPASACEDPSSDWYQFVTSPAMLADSSNFLSGDPPSAGPGHWELFASDFDLAASELGNNAFRMSLEWSRIFPAATDGIEGYEALKAAASAEAIAHYHAVFAALKARGLKPLVTLNHYTLPIWIHDGVGCHEDLAGCSRRGWVDRERTVREIAKYAGFCAREFGAEVDLWATLNEPFSGVMLAGYVFPSRDRTNPPAVRLRADEAKIVYRALIEAHARMYDAVKENDAQDADGDGVPAEIGVVYAMVPVAPRDPKNPRDVQAAQNIYYLWNLAYLNAVAKGDFDANLDGNAVRRADLAGRMDYIGINYYTRITVEGFDGPVFPQLSPLSTFNPLTFQAWEDYPRGIYEMAMAVKGMGLPMFITENGLALEGDGEAGPSFLVRHLTWLSRAIRDGARVRGYFYWSLFDNYEWNHGMNMRFGLYAVDKGDPSKRRRARPSVAVYRRIAREGRIPPDLAAKYPAR
jgi:beta-galactosidase